MDRGLWALAPTPIKINNLKVSLSQYPRISVADELLKGFSHGFRLHYLGPRHPTECSNLVSVSKNPDATRAKILNEVSLGRVLGPFSNKPISTLRISPIGIVPKSDGKWRLITHLSFPFNHSVNDFIEYEYSTVQYSKFDNIIEMIASLGKGALLGKIDIKSAFRLLPIHPGDFDLLGFKFEDKYYIDKCLPMGCSVSCNLFEKFSTFLHWLAENRVGLNSLDHYLDDFIFCGKRDSKECELLMNGFQNICSELGVPLADEKTVGPVTCLVFLGYEVDTVEMMIRVPPKKMTELIQNLSSLLGSKKVTRSQLESLVGSLSFFCKAIVPGRAFLRRFYDLMTSVSAKYHHIRISQITKEDILMWLNFLSDFNGRAYIHSSIWEDNSTLCLYTDSSGSHNLGCGAYLRGSWTFYQWPGNWDGKPILGSLSLLEFIPIVLSIMIWGPRLANKRIKLMVDNLALVSILNTQSSRSSTIMVLVREFVLLIMKYNIQFKARHVRGIDNDIADSISRKQWERFRKLAPRASEYPEVVPKDFHSLISRLNVTGC